MAESAEMLDVYLEVGNKRAFACAVDWPGWSRSGRDETSALQALVGHGPRYSRVAEAAGLTLALPSDESDLRVVERLAGDATTDFGAPGAVPPFDSTPLGDADLERLRALVAACWQALDAAVAAAEGRELRKGPRGGGREAEKIVSHVLDAERSYLHQVGRRSERGPDATPTEALTRAREAALGALDAAARGELPTRGPRGGTLWPARYYVRRSAWHVLDHAWEIEDRII